MKKAINVLFTFIFLSLKKVQRLFLCQDGDNISDFGGLFMVWLTKSKFLSLSLFLFMLQGGVNMSVCPMRIKNIWKFCME
jgi:hypothetical protein